MTGSSSILLVILVFGALFSMLYVSAANNDMTSHNRHVVAMEPKISQEQAIRIAESRIEENRWYFKYPENSSPTVLDFNGTNYHPALEFQGQQGKKLPLVSLYLNGTLVDRNGQFSSTIEACKKERGLGYCEFISSLRGSAEGGDLAYLVGLDWGYTHLFVVDAMDGTLLNSTIYLRPILYQEDVQRDLEELGKPDITQQQAISIVEKDLKKRNPDSHGITGIEYDRKSYVSFQEFMSKKLDLPLMYTHPSGTIIYVVNGTRPEMGYYCDSPIYPYCGFTPPLNLNSKGRLIYGIDFVSDAGPGMYAVDAHTGEIVDSLYLREEARR